jgi:hypothetical protein
MVYEGMREVVENKKEPKDVPRPIYYTEIRESDGFWLPNVDDVGAQIRIWRFSHSKTYTGTLHLEFHRGLCRSLRVQWTGVGEKDTWQEVRDELERAAREITHEYILGRLEDSLPRE